MDYKKELEIALTCYIAEKHTQEECTGFIAGFKALQKVVKNINYDTVLGSDSELLPKPIEAYDKAQQLNKGGYINWWLKKTGLR